MKHSNPAISSKNRLQEFCHKNKLPMPEYTSKPIICPDNSLKWNSSVSIVYQKEILTACSKQPAKKMVLSEKEAAQNLINLINDKISLKGKTTLAKSTLSEDTDKEIIISTKYLTDIFLIDLETVHFEENQLDLPAIYIGFINRSNPKRGGFSHWHTCISDRIIDEINHSSNNFLLYEIEGDVANLMNYYMTLMTYPVINYLMEVFSKSAKPKKKPVILIISRNPSSWGTYICLYKAADFNKLSINVARNDSFHAKRSKYE